jgi:hypothetical protein
MSLSGYRMLLGLAAMLHFVERAVAASVERSWREAALAGAAAVLGGVVARGVAASGAAVVMNVLAVALYRAAAAPTLDDYAANLIPLLMILVCAAEPGTGSGRRNRGTGLGLFVVCAAVVGVYVGGGPFAFFIDSSRSPAWIRWSFRVAAVLLVAPSSPVRTGGVVLQACLHALLSALGPYRLVHLMFGGSALLFASLRSTSNRGHVIDAASILGVSALVIASAAYVDVRYLGQDVSRSARVLAAVGILPIPFQTSVTEGARFR